MGQCCRAQGAGDTLPRRALPQAGPLELCGPDREPLQSERGVIDEAAAETGVVDEDSADHAYFLDWLGVGAIYLVVFYHAVHLLDKINFFGSVPGASAVVSAYRATTIQVGMPLFFYAFGNVAGKSGNKSRSCAETLRKSSSLRLFLPFLFFCLTFAPAMQYFDEEEKIDPSNPGIFHLKKNPVTWLWRFYTSSGLGKLWIFGKLDLAWLWFLPAFWVVEILSIPLFGFAERRPRWEIYCAGASVLWLGLAVLLVTCFRFSLQFALFAVAGPVCTALLTCKWPLPPYNLVPSRDTKEAKRAWIAIRVAKAIQIACNVGLVTSFGYECLDWQGGACVEGQEGIDWQGGKCVISTDSNITYAQCVKQEDCHYQWPRNQRNSYDKGYLREAVPFISLCLGFYVQGFFSQRWFRSAQHIDDIRKMPSFKFKSYRLLGFFLVAIGIMGTSTLGGVEADHYTYPIYSNTYCKGPYFGAIFVIGTWVFLSWIYPLAKAYVNCKINAWLHHYAKNSCLVVYGVHWLWLKIFVFWMVEPSVRYCKEPWSILSLFGHCPDPESGYENPLATVGILFMVIAATLVASWGTYAILLQLSYCCSCVGVTGVAPHRDAPAPTESGRPGACPGEPSPPRGTDDDRQRYYFLDWIRVIAIYLVVCYHVVQALDWVSFFDNVPGAIRLVSSFRATSLQFGMPLFFYISGKSSGMGRKTKSFRQTLKARCQRLLIPFVIFYATFIPFWQYVDESRDPKHPGFWHTLLHPCPDQDTQAPGSCDPVRWLLHYWTSDWIFNKFDLAWLWFLPALFVVEVLSSPLFLSAETGPRRGDGWKTYCGAASVLWLGLAVLLVVAGFSRHFALYAVAGPICTALLAWIAPLPDHSREGSRPAWLAMRIAQAIQMACNVGLVTSFGYEGKFEDSHWHEGIDWQGGRCTISAGLNISYFRCVRQAGCHYEWPKDPHSSHDPRAAIPFILLCLGFFVQGFFSQRWFRSAGQMGDIGDMPSGFQFCQLLGWFLTIFGLIATSTLGEVETQHYIYPVYSNSYCKGPYFGALHVMGTWAFLGMIYPLAKALLNDKIDAEFHHYANNSFPIVYGVHWLWLKVFVFWIVEPSIAYCKEQRWWILSILSLRQCPEPPGFENPLVTIAILLVVLAATLICSWATYALLLSLRVGRFIGVVPYLAHAASAS